MTWLLLGICILTSGFSGNVYKQLSGESKSRTATFLMGGGLFLPLFLFFGVRWLLCGRADFLPIAAVVGGICIALAVTALIESMKHAALSFSVILMNLSFLIPILLSVLFLREAAVPLQLCGTLLAVAVIILLHLRGGSKEKGAKRGVLTALIASVANGGYNFCIKVNENAGGNEGGFFALSYLSALLFCLLLWVLSHRAADKNAVFSRRRTWVCLGYLLLLSFFIGLEYFLVGKLAGRLNATVQFTVITVSAILLSLTVGVLFQGEKLTKKTVVSALLCALAVAFQFITI